MAEGESASSSHRFWSTQPVPLLQTTTGEEGPILPNEACKASDTPENLHNSFEWCEVDLDNESELKELYDLLFSHYVEDLDGNFRFNYSPRFLQWALKPPSWRREWHIGVRAKPADPSKKGKLVAFIAGTPARLKVREAKFNITEINYLTVHHKLRSKRLAPVLIKEVTRRCYQNNIFQALYTAGTLLPTPFATSRYFHRSLDWEHLYKNGFSHIPLGSTELRQKLKYKLDTKTSIKGLRPMKKDDVPAVMDLLQRYLERFAVRPEFSAEETEHYFCSEASKDVVWAYVVEEQGKITDFFSYYNLETSVLMTKQTIRAAYLYYYATETAFTEPTSQDKLRDRLRALMHVALIMAKKDNFHVFNALTILDNPLFLKDQRFEPGDGKLHFYLFNWRTGPVPGGIDEKMQVDESKMGGVGVVML